MRDERVLRLEGPLLPRWASELLGAHPIRQNARRDRLQAACQVTADWTLVRVACPGAAALPDEEFERQIVMAYAWAHELLESHPPRCVVRMWNFVPAIGRPVANGHDRYSVFNAGRYAAFTRWFGGDDFAPRLPAASGVDARTDDFVVYALGRREPGRAIENTRQRSAYRYSARYGPIPPCFSRGTVVRSPGARPGDWILVSGTASVVGEDSAHPGDLAAQVEETKANLAQLVRPVLGVGTDAEALRHYRALRVYLVRENDAAQVIRAFLDACPLVRELEWMPTGLCRQELLVEVEGVVDTSLPAPA
jgi:enamine deaminase RidA (YjgF/YER057c/UK114 family)